MVLYNDSYAAQSSIFLFNHHPPPPPHFHPSYMPLSPLFTTTTMAEPQLLIDQFNDSDDELIEETIPFIITTAVQASQNTELMRPAFEYNSSYVQDLLTIAHPQRCWDVLRMTIVTFYALRDWLLANTSLKSSRVQSGVSIEEKLVIFLYIVAHGASVRETCERLSYAPGTISRLVISLRVYY